MPLVMEELYDEFPGRNGQIDCLSEFFYKGNAGSLPDVFFVYGVHSSGKTSLVTKLLSLKPDQIHFALINCIECYTTKLLFESIVSQLFNDTTTRSCPNLMMLIDYLKLFYQQSDKENHIILVMDNCEYLDNIGEEYMRGFIKLRELSSIPTLSLVLISHLVPDKFSTDLSAAIPIYFPQYNKDELLRILMKSKPSTCTDQFYLNYLKAALSVFYRVSRDLSEISHMVNSNFKKYCEPLENKEVKEDNMVLWRNIVPHLKASLHSAFSTNQPISEKPQEEYRGTDTKGLLAFDLPYFSKYFLIASYLASYNSPKHDKRLYLKNHGKRRKRKTDSKKQSKDALSIQLLGPRIFPLIRLLTIFYSIIEDRPVLTANLLSQVSTLVELRLLIHLADGVLDKPTYKCMATYSCVESVAKTVGFNVEKYLMA